MIPQGAWRRMFHYIKYNQELRQILNNILTSKDEKISEFIDQLYKLNTGKKNNLTGKSANAINAFLFVSDPKRYLSVVSLNHREKIINYFKFSGGPNFQSDTVGVKVYLSNKAIIEGFKRIGINSDPRTVSVFLYRVLKEAWNPSTAETDSSGEEDISEVAKPMEKAMDLATFYLEEELENFLIKNWEKTELGKEYDLIEEEDDMVSQQYKTDIGKIDILAKDKKTMQYVVIELKRDQSSDDTVGQIARYMGWIEEKKSPGKSVKGIIIAAQYDDRLRYALKKIKDVEVYLYKVDFKLSEFRNG
ncbi:hypothetical protein COU37_01365 [Candidatus Micrarchaeota archaeon CG10_big_fil_rev_8_21_14_0_10_45_29]|nr:MAG: hypothetical protein COU37_01365 [Candidatus Micrarchaeota archaeon CG10_big_fil_rev_8_21_14_0_10_45_29]